MKYSLKVSKDLIIEFFLVVMLKLILEYTYVYFVCEYYGYAGFNLAFSPEKYLFSWVLYIVIFLTINAKKHVAVYEILAMIFILYVTPNLIYYSMSDAPTVPMLALILPFLFIVMSIMDTENIQLRAFAGSRNIILALALLLILVVVAHFLKVTRMNFVLSFSDVYDFRDEYGEVSNQGIFGYLNNWVMKVFAVLFFAWALKNKKVLLSVTALFNMVILFIYSGHKSALFGIFIVLLFMTVFKFRQSLVIILSLFTGTFLSIATYTTITGNLSASSYIIRRMLFVPSFINYKYFDFFSYNPHVYWSNNLLKSINIYPYDASASVIIGRYINGTEMAANTGFIANGYMHAGYLGMVFYTLLGAVLLNIINMLAYKVDKFVVASIVFIPLFTMFISADLVTTVITHGLLIALFVLYMYKDDMGKLIKR